MKRIFAVIFFITTLFLLPYNVSAHRKAPTKKARHKNFSGAITTSSATGTISAYFGSASASPNIQQFSVSGSSLSDNIVATAPTGFEVSLTAGGVYVSSVTLTEVAGTVSATTIYVRSSATASAGSLSGNVVLTSTSTNSQSVAVTGTVSSIPNQTVTNGNSTSAVYFAGTGCIYKWTNNNNSIGLASSGTGNIGSFTAVNNGSTGVTATITATPAGPYAYIANQGGHNVSVIDLSTNTVVSTVNLPNGSQPYGVTAGPLALRIYVTDYGTNKVSIINTADNSILNNIAVGLSPLGVITSPDGNTVYVVNNVSETVSVINAQSESVYATIPVGQSPTCAAISPDGSLLYVVNSNSNDVTVINTSTNMQVGSTIPVGQDPFAAAISPDGSTLYVTNASDNTVSVINTATSTVVATLNVGTQPQGITISLDGTKVYTTNFVSNDVSVITTATNAVTSISMGPNTNPNGISVSPDGNYVYVADQQAGYVTIINIATNMLVGTPITVGTAPYAFGNFITPGMGCTPVTFTYTVNPTPPTISATGTLSPLSTVYGTASSSGSFNVSSINLTAGVLVTPPTGFEVSLDNSTFSNTVTVGTGGNLSAVSVYFRLKSTTGVGGYSGNFVLTSTGASTVDEAIGNSTVTAAALTITAFPQSKPYGMALSGSSGVTIFSYSGLQNSETINSISLAYGTGASAPAPVGTYTSSITPSAATGGSFSTNNYTITYVSASLFVEPVALTITANNVSKAYGATLTGGAGSAAFSAAGLQNTDAVGTVTLGYGTGSNAADVVGIYNNSVTPSAPIGAGFSASNYTITYVEGNITVTTAALNITANNVSKVYGSAVTGGAGSTAFVATGLQGSDAVGSVSIAYGTGAASTAAVGNYNNSVTPSAASGSFTASNYTITYTQGNISVTQAFLIISANSVSKVYGSTLTGGAGSTAFSAIGLKNTDAISSVTLAYGTGSSATDAVSVYTNTAIPSAASGTFIASNYAVTYAPGNITVTPAPLTVIANTINKVYGSTLTASAGSSAFSETGLQNSDIIASVTMSYGTGANPTDGVGTYNNSATPSAPTGTGFSAANYTITYTRGNITVTPAQLTIFAVPQTKTYGTLLSGSAGSTSFSYSGAKNLETVGSITITYGAGRLATDAVGAYTASITPSAAVGGSFNPNNYTIIYIGASLTVTTAALTITANNVSKVYGATLTGGAGLTTFSATGLKNADVVNSVTLAYGAGSNASDPVGVYNNSSTPSAATGTSFLATNYTITYSEGNITVTPAALTITANSVSKVYGSTLAGGVGSTAFSATGLKNSDVISSVTLAYSIGSAATAAVGTYNNSATPSAATGTAFPASNYTITYAQGNITVTPAALTITANSVSKVYGATLTGSTGSTTFSITGLKNSDIVSSVTLAYGTGAAATAAVGTYNNSTTPSVATGTTFLASNYTITYAQGNITVNPAVLTITANSVSKVYGSTLTGGTGSTAFLVAGLQNSDAISSVTVGYGAGSLATANVGVYSNSISPSGAVGNFTPANYTTTYAQGNITITPAALTITANNVTKTYGTTLTGGPGSTAFAPSGLQNGETVVSVTVAYGAGAAATAAAGTYTASVIPSLATGGTFNPGNYAITYNPGNILINAVALPVITTGAVTGTITACAGSYSISPNVEQFTITGTNLLVNITVTSPAGFEVSSLAQSGYASSIILNQQNGNTTGLLYVRSTPTAPAGNPSGNVVLTSGTSTQNVGVTATISALPTINAIANQVFTAGANTNAVFFNGSGNAFTWTNDTPGIGLAASGTGSIPSFTAMNTGNSPITAKITVTPTASPGYAYICNSGANNVSVINTVTNKVATTITVGSNPVGVSISPDKTTVYIANSGSNTVSVINVATNTVVATVPVGQYPYSVTVSPDGSKVYVANNHDGTISVINTATNTVSSTFKISTNNLYVLVSPDGNLLYVSDNINNLVYVVNTSTGLVVASITILSEAYGMVLSPDGSRLYVGSYNTDNIDVVNTTNNTLIFTYSVTGLSVQALAISADGKWLYVTDRTHSDISGVNFDLPPPLLTIPVGVAPQSIGVSPDGTTLYVPNSGAASVSVINIATQAIISTVPVGNTPISFGNFITPTTSCDGLPITFNITVNPIVPFINQPPALTQLSTTYGTPSPPVSFLVSASNLNSGVLVTPPVGFEVSTDNVTYAATIAVSTTGNAVPVYIRLTSVTPVGTYSGNIKLTNSTVTTVNVVVPPSQVTPAPLTITVNNITKSYGTPLANITGSAAFVATGLQNFETIKTININYAVGAASTATVNTYKRAIVPSAASGGTFTPTNYNITYVSGDIIVTPSPLIITANNAAKVFGIANPDLTVSYTGFVNNETDLALTTVPNLSTTANILSKAGQYPITASGAVSPNYTFTYFPGVLTITNAAAVVTIPNTFTPNGDGVNDTWDIKYLGTYVNSTVEIVNRYGLRVFYSRNYPVPWDGKYKGAEVPAGTYYYIINLNDGSKPLAGFLAIIR